MNCSCLTVLLICGGVMHSPLVVEGGPARLVTAPDAGGGPYVKVLTARTLTTVGSFFSYPSDFRGGVRVAVGDVDGDGGPDLITGSGPGSTRVNVYLGGGLAESRSFLAYDLGFTGGVFVAVGDVDGDGLDDIIAAPDQGGSAHVKVFSGATGAEIHSFFAYPVGFTGGVRVAAGDVNGDGRADIVTGADSTSPVVKVFSGTDATELRAFFAYATEFRGGVRVAAGDLDGDGLAEIITSPGAGMAPEVRVFDGFTLAERASWLAYNSDFLSGVFVGASSLTRPALTLLKDPYKGIVRFRWPAGLVASLQSNSTLDNPKSWETLSVNPIRVGNRVEVDLPPDKSALFFRLSCDDEALP